jgi:3-deoxy-D-arabino-heptulosonate 7-phosphate (DAHP) synthase
MENHHVYPVLMGESTINGHAIYVSLPEGNRQHEDKRQQPAGRDVTAGCIELCIPIAWLNALFCIYSKVSKHSRNVDIL